MDRVEYRKKVNCSWDEWEQNYHCWQEGCEDVIPSLDAETMEAHGWWWKQSANGEWKAYCHNHSGLEEIRSRIYESFPLT